MIEPYDQPPLACHDADPAAGEAAAALGQMLIAGLPPGFSAEHIGSSAVPDCHGKGVLDLMLLYPAGGLAQARDRLAALGFQPQSTRDPFPEDRPMRVGRFTYRGQTYPIHVHVLAVDSAEVGELLAFRDLLRRDAGLREAYVALKRTIIAGGVTDTVEYCEAKTAFIRAAVGGTAEGA